MGFLAPIGAAIAAGATAATATTTATMATIAAASTVASGLYMGISAQQQGAYQAKVAQQNAATAENNRVSELGAGNSAAENQHLLTGRRVAGALAAQGANGVDTGFGTTSQTRDAIQNVGDLDAMTMQYNASSKALGYATQEAGYKADAGMASMAGNNQMYGSFLSTAASVGGQFATNTRTGVWKTK